MKKSIWLVYCRKILWLIGLLLLVMLLSKIEKIIQQNVSETFNFMPVIWSNPFIAVLLGFYISLIIVKKWVTQHKSIIIMVCRYSLFVTYVRLPSFRYI
ncbi:hypothetical protein H131_11408 [Lysinibacillus sphaericus OT4b.31]|uniref:Uncharacterized protein n=1 Tax=Lysinibacillus sphaericus OT4b.31 TaxID=1285586 RepID=R7ZF83_LYSSH|nr:hypothetical protein H131_11408 [Lysinibacillus sphaericus OT4b.31]